MWYLSVYVLVVLSIHLSFVSSSIHPSSSSLKKKMMEEEEEGGGGRMATAIIS
jgi:hypothetical protein